jgi:hypothetical protein
LAATPGERDLDLSSEQEKEHAPLETSLVVALDDFVAIRNDVHSALLQDRDMAQLCSHFLRQTFRGAIRVDFLEGLI